MTGFRYITEERNAARADALGGGDTDSERSAIQSHSTAVTDGTWNGPAQVAKANGAAELKYMHAWYAGSEPDKKGSYKFPHHAAGTGTPANINGVNNAKARLPNANIPSSDVSGVEAHLNRHQTDWKNKQKSELTDEMRAQRAANPYRGIRYMPVRMDIRSELVNENGKTFYQVEGYAATWGDKYVMYDMFGPFMERVASDALDTSLNADPDVAFLLNHKGMTMARTTNGSLKIYKDEHGLGVFARLNAERTDVRDMMSAINDGLIDQMSWAFRMLDGEWDEDFTEFTITQADINRGDVSAVNYGANPYTDIGARAADDPDFYGRAQLWAMEADIMPESVTREVVERIELNVSTVRAHLETRERVEELDARDEIVDGPETSENPARDSSEPVSMRVSLMRNRLALVEDDELDNL